MTRQNLEDPRQKKIMAELDEIGDRLERGEITSEQAGVESDEILHALQRQLMAEAEAKMAEQARTRSRNAMLLLGLVLLAVVALVSYRYLR